MLPCQNQNHVMLIYQSPLQSVNTFKTPKFLCIFMLICLQWICDSVFFLKRNSHTNRRRDLYPSWLCFAFAWANCCFKIALLARKSSCTIRLRWIFHTLWLVWWDKTPTHPFKKWLTWQVLGKKFILNCLHISIFSIKDIQCLRYSCEFKPHRHGKS